jgi:hypothetical protein
MFSDFAQHVIGVPQVAGIGGNVTFDGPGADEDFGLEQVTGNSEDRYMFRTAPLRNAALNRAFMHNGAFLRLEDAIRPTSIRTAPLEPTQRWICPAICSPCSIGWTPNSRTRSCSRRKASMISWTSSATACSIPRRDLGI